MKSFAKVMHFAVVALVVAFVGTTSAQAITVTNAGFDPPDEDVSDNPSPGYGPISDWNNSGFSGVNPDDSAGSPFLNGLPPHGGTHVGFQQGSGTISQNVTGYDSDRLYTATYFVNERGVAGNSATSTQVSLDGGATSFAQPDNIVRTPQYRRIMSGPLAVSGPSSDLEISAAGVSGDNTLLMDSVSITRAVPLVGDLGFEFPVQTGTGFDGFEQASGTGNGTLAGSAWTFANGGGITNGQSAFNPPEPPEGNQAAILQDNASTDSLISQVISGFEPRVSYSLSFAAAGRQSGNGANEFQVLLDGIPLTFGGADSVLPTAGSFDTFTSDVFKTPGGSFTLSFEGLNSGGGDQTSFIDDVRFNFVAEAPVPEPSTLVLAVVGMLSVVPLRRSRP